MSKLQAVICAATLLFAGSAVTEAQASQVLTIPFSSALAHVDSLDSCDNNFPYNWRAGTNGCALTFPLTIPAGHVIHQISVLHSTDNSYPFPNFRAAVEVFDLQAYSWHESFIWTSFDFVPDGTIDNHRLMSQTKFGYPDEFSVVPNTNYSVQILVAQGGSVEGIQVTYD